MNKVFVVTSGTYSDYSIDSIFTTIELAQSFIDIFKDEWNTMEIEERDLDPNKTHITQKRKPFFLRINKNGDVDDLSVANSSCGFKEDMPKAQIRYTRDLEWMNIKCFARNKNHAVKIAGEIRAQILANNSWGSSSFY